MMPRVRRRRVVVVLTASLTGCRSLTLNNVSPRKNFRSRLGSTKKPLGEDALVAFQGEPGAYSEEAAYQHFGPGVKTLPCKSFNDVFDAVESGTAMYGMLPMENSQAGSINKSYDLLMEYDLRIHGETVLRVHHCLLALPPIDDDLKNGIKLPSVVRSHPQALAQCEGYILANNLAIEAGSDTAGSAREIAERQLRGVGAICSKLAAEKYGLDILASKIEDNKFNFTRFFILGKGQPIPEIASPKTSVVFAVSNKPGSLVAALQEFGQREVNLIKLESRPRRKTAALGFQYIFYLDFEGHHSDSQCAAALMGLLEECAFVKLLGSYEAAPPIRDIFEKNGNNDDKVLDPALMQI